MTWLRAGFLPSCREDCRVAANLTAGNCTDLCATAAVPPCRRAAVQAIRVYGSLPTACEPRHIEHGACNGRTVSRVPLRGMSRRDVPADNRQHQRLASSCITIPSASASRSRAFVYQGPGRSCTTVTCRGAAFFLGAGARRRSPAAVIRHVSRNLFPCRQVGPGFSPMPAIQAAVPTRR